MKLYQIKHSPFYYYTFDLNGRRYRGTTKERTRREAEIVAKNIFRATRAGDGGWDLKPRDALGKLLDRFEEFVHEHASLETKSKQYYLRGVKLLRACSLAKMAIIGISTSAVDTVKIAKTPAMRNTALRTLRRALWLARDRNVIPTIPRIHLAKEAWRTRVFTPEEETLLLRHAGQPLRDIFMLLSSSGMRPAEAFGLRWKDVDLKCGCLHVSKGKTRASRRYVGLTERMTAVLAARQKKAKSEWVFPSKRSRSGHVESMSKSFSRARKRAGLPKDLLLYSCRHTYATNLISLTKDVQLTAAQMGHSSVANTARYLHPTTKQVASIMSQFERERATAFCPPS